MYHKNTPCTAASLSKVFITHLHLDHVGGLASMLSIICNGFHFCVLINILGYLQQHDTGFKIYGPKGIAQLLTTIFSITGTYIVSPIEIYEFLHPDEKLSGSCFFRCLFVAAGSAYSSVSVNAIYPDADGYWTVFSVFLPFLFYSLEL